MSNSNFTNLGLPRHLRTPPKCPKVFVDGGMAQV
jgi:hypothetical protein